LLAQELAQELVLVVVAQVVEVLVDIEHLRVHLAEEVLLKQTLL
jgi:hypothetical protein